MMNSRYQNALEIAIMFDDFMYEHDPYGYADAFPCREEGISNALELLLDGSADALAGITEFFDDDIFTDDDIEYRERGVKILEQINAFAGR